MATELLAEHRDLDRPEPDPAALGRRLDTEPALVGHRRPERGVVRGSAAGVRTHPGRGREPVEELPRAVAERQLIVGEVEVHGGASLASPWP